MTAVAKMPDPRLAASELVEAVHTGNVLAVHRVLHPLDGEELRAVAQYLASCHRPDAALVPANLRLAADADVVAVALAHAARAFGLTAAEARTGRQFARVRARHVAAAACLRLGMTSIAVGRCLSLDHSTVLYARQKVAADDMLDAFAQRIADRLSTEVVVR